MSQNIDYSKGIYDARQLGAGRMLILGVQHMFAMFGATVLVPLLTGLSVSTTLLCAGLGTLLFHFITKGKVPAFLGSSFAYLGGFSIVAPMLADADGNLTIANTQMLPYACAGVAFSGLVYLAVSLLISTFGIRRIMRFFPPVVTGPIIIAIGLILAPSAISNCQANWLLAFVALGTVIVCNIWGKGMVKILPILIGVLVSYAVALVTGAVDFERIASAAWFGIPLHKEAMGLFAIDGSPEFISALFTIIPIALATMMEHVGDIAAISATVGHNYINDPGLNRTLMGDGLATTLAGLLGGPANTTYGENTGVLALSKIYDPLVIRIAAVLAIIVVANIWGKGMVKILPILIGVLVSYAVALVTGAVDFQRISEAAWVGIPLHKEAMGLFAIDGSPEFISALFTIIPIALATMMEHVGDIAAISATVGHNYINDPGLNRTLLGDGLATTMAGLLGGPANTTYGENTGVLALSKIYDPLVIRIAAVLAIILSFSPKFEAVINTIPTGIIGGISFVLYGMISAIGVRNVVENRVDFTNSRNLIVAAVILVCALGFNSVGGVSFAVAGVTINLSGLAVAAIAGILLNAILPGNDYEFDAADGSEAATSSNLQV